jgi:hypothetical protein
MHYLTFVVVVVVVLVVGVCRTEDRSSSDGFASANEHPMRTVERVSAGNGADAVGSQNGVDASVRLDLSKNEKHDVNTDKAANNIANSNSWRMAVPMVIGLGLVVCYM